MLVFLFNRENKWNSKNDKGIKSATTLVEQASAENNETSKMFFKLKLSIVLK